MGADWCWFGEEEASFIIVPPVAGIAVYLNDCGNLVIRQQEVGLDDNVIVIPFAQAEHLVNGILRTLAK